MDLSPAPERRTLDRCRRLGFPLLGVLLLLGGLASPGGAAYRIVDPEAQVDGSEVATALIGTEGSHKEYWRIDQGCDFRILGPGTLRFYVRAHVPAQGANPETVAVALDGLGSFDTQRWFLEVKPSRVSTYGGGTWVPLAGGPTGGESVTLAVPGGLHRISVKATSNIEMPVFGRFSYDGPPTPDPAAAAAAARVPWEFAGNFAFETIYDDNVCRYSDATLAEFRRNETPEEFAIIREDDVIFNPTIEVEALRPLLFGKTTRFRGRYTRWEYANNHIKTNDEYQLRFRQYFRRSDFLEGTYTYAPNSYIKELRDRPPFTSVTVDRVYRHFEITRNAFELSYFYRVNSLLYVKLDGGRTLRFYNRPFLENDLWEWNGSLESEYRHKSFRFRLHYAYADVKARSVDQVGETIDTSDNDGDGSYEKDTYRLRLTYRPKRSPFRAGPIAGGPLQVVAGLVGTLGSWIDRGLVAIRTQSIYFQYDYVRQFYTSQRPLHIDPLHVGRLDESFQPRVVWNSRRLGNRLSLEAGVRYTQRTANGPAGAIGEDDPSEEKDYTGTRYWITVTRPLW